MNVYDRYIDNYVYNKKDNIGKGSFSKVYRGYKQDSDDVFAIKKIYRKNDNKFEDYIRKEIEIMEKLNHKNIIKLYDKYYTDKYIYLILELCNSDLDKYIKNNNLCERDIKFIMKQIVDALKYMMDNKIVHRDLKPHNILINKNMIIKIGDFGFARKFRETQISETVCGSPLYMAPELLNNNKYNIKSDLWSLGVILYQMFMKSYPYNAKNLNELIELINIKEPLKWKKKINNEAKDLIEKLLVYNYNDRIEWDELFNNKWINENKKGYDKEIIEEYDENNILDNKIINKLNTLRKIDSFDYCIDNSILNYKEIKNKEYGVINLNNFIIDDFLRII